MRAVFLVVYFMATLLGSYAQSIITTIAGTGVQGYTGNGGPATSATFYHPIQTITDNAGNRYIADWDNHVIRKVDASGVVTLFAGTGVAGFSGDGGLATSAQINRPSDILFDTVGNMIVVDEFNLRIRKITPAGIISTIAGGGGTLGDGGPATAAQFTKPFRACYDRYGNLYIADTDGHRIRKINTTGIISTFAGTGAAGFSGNGTSATSAQLNYPTGLVADTLGNVYVVDEFNHRVRKINTSGIITTVAGTGALGYLGDGGPATSARFNYPQGIAIDSVGNLYIADTWNHAVRKISSSTGMITSITGTNGQGYSGDGGPPSAAKINTPTMVSMDAWGNLIVSDWGNNVVRKITPSCTPPSVNISGVTSLCSGNGTVLSASGATSYTWSPNAGGVTTNTVAVFPTSTTIYTLTSSDGTCTGTNTITVTVTQTPSLNISGNTNLCSGSSTILSGSGASSYTWNTGSVTVNTSTISANPGSTVSFTLTGANGACTDTEMVTINVTPTPTLSISGATSICSGNGTVLTASGASGYTWSPNAGSATTSTVALSPSGSTTYTLTGANGSCIVFNTVTVTVTPTPTLNISGSTTVCSGNPVALTGSGADTYTWSANAGSVNTSTVSLTPGSTDTYTLSGTEATGTCTNYTTITVTVQPSPVITVGAQTICVGNTATLTATGANTFSWSPSPAFSNGSGSMVIDGPSQTTTYTVTGTGSNGCIGTTSVILTVDSCQSGIASKGLSGAITLAPNPNTGVFFLNIQFDADFTIYDMLGAKVMSGRITSGEKEVRMENVPNGVYFIAINTKEGLVCRRFIIER